MNYQNVIDYKIQMLIDLMLTDGVSPCELSDNIFEEKYISISFSKINGYIVGKLNFYENENVLQNVQMIYTYSKDKVLMKIEEEVSGKKQLLWDRKSREEDLMEEILYYLKHCYNQKQIDKFIMSLPKNLKDRISEYMSTLSA